MSEQKEPNDHRVLSLVDYFRQFESSADAWIRFYGDSVQPALESLSAARAIFESSKDVNLRIYAMDILATFWKQQNVPEFIHLMFKVAENENENLDLRRSAVSTLADCTSAEQIPEIRSRLHAMETRAGIARVDSPEYLLLLSIKKSQFELRRGGKQTLAVGGNPADLVKYREDFVSNVLYPDFEEYCEIESLLGVKVDEFLLSLLASPKDSSSIDNLLQNKANWALYSLRSRVMLIQGERGLAEMDLRKAMAMNPESEKLKRRLKGYFG